MKIEKVKLLAPFERFLYWVKAREAIRIRKERGDPHPWTDDETLQKYRFCNIRRMDDRVSRWLLNNWYTPFFDHPNVLTACVLARHLNNTDTLEAVGFPKTWNPFRVRKILEGRAERNLKNFSAAYIITGSLGGSKIVQVVDKVVNAVHQAKIKPDSSSMEATHCKLVGLPGIQSFMAGQIVADLRWAMSGTWSDAKIWAPIGPGSRRGLSRLHNKPLNTVWKQKEFLALLQELILKCSSKIPLIHSRLEAIDYQNCLCEYDKYCRVLLGEGRPKQLYRVK
jgi:hypothetical protein